MGDLERDTRAEPAGEGDCTSVLSEEWILAVGCAPTADDELIGWAGRLWSPGSRLIAPVAARPRAVRLVRPQASAAAPSNGLLGVRASAEAHWVR